MHRLSVSIVFGFVFLIAHVSWAQQDKSPETGNRPAAQPFQQTTTETNSTLRWFDGRGFICELATNGETVVIRHEEIPGFMPKMTMQFNVRNTNEVRGLQVGDEITFCIKATDEESWIELLKPIKVRDQASRSVQPVTQLAHFGKLKPGELMPDVQLLGEDGRPVRLSDFRGNALALTFFFTRCPLPDFCPRMSRDFSRARELLLQLSPGPTNWQFLSISFDPEFDTPGIITRYAENYRGRNSDRWLFATASTDALAIMTSQLDFRFANDGGSLVHNLRTVVLDPQGRLYRQFNGNQFKPDELAQAIAEAAESKP